VRFAEMTLASSGPLAPPQFARRQWRQNKAPPLIKEALALCQAQGHTAVADKPRMRLTALTS